MKKRICILLVLLLLTLSGCAESVPQTEKPESSTTAALAVPTTTPATVPTTVPHEKAYDIMVENGQYFLVFTEEFKKSKELPEDMPHFDGLVGMWWPEFSSISEMKKGIQTGDLSSLELDTLFRFTEKNEAGEALICDLSNIQEGYVPEGFSLTRVVWAADSYWLTYLRDDGACIGINLYDEETYQRVFALEYSELEEHSSMTLIGQEQEPERNATVYYYTTGTTKLKYIRYELQSQNKHCYVSERYAIGPADGHDDHGSYDYSDTVPVYVDIWGTENGIHFRAMYDGGPRPSLEFLSQIGIQKFVETETE